MRQPFSSSIGRLGGALVVRSSHRWHGVGLGLALVLAAGACVDRVEVGTFAANAAVTADGAPSGDPDASDGAPPAPIVVTPATTPIAAGGVSTCALDAKGGVVCWGDNHHGTLGIGAFDPADSVAPLGVSGLTSGVRSVAGGPFAQCAILVDGTARCWGDSLFGDIQGTTGSVQMPAPHDKTGLSNDVADRQFGLRFACALTTSGRGKCWGLGGAGQLGNGSTGDEYTARDLATTEPLVAISASMGGLFACAVTSAGEVLCWGQNNVGQLGSSGTTDQPRPVAVAGLPAATKVSCGREHACALLADGGIACWGSDAQGQLGRGSAGPGSGNAPARVAGVARATSITVGGAHACASVGGAIRCWGANDLGQIGSGAAVLPSTEVTPASFGAVGVSAGLEHTCVISAARAVRCIGDATYKQIGAGSFSL